MLRIKRKRINYFLYAALLLLVLFLIRSILDQEVRISNFGSVLFFVFFLFLHIYHNYFPYLIINEEAIVKKDFFRKEKVFFDDITRKILVEEKYIIQTSSNTMDIDLKAIDDNSLESLFKILNKAGTGQRVLAAAPSHGHSDEKRNRIRQSIICQLLKTKD